MPTYTKKSKKQKKNILRLHGDTGSWAVAIVVKIYTKADVKVFWSCPVTLALYTFRNFFVTDFVATGFLFEISHKHTKKRFPKLEYARVGSIFSVALEFWQYPARSVLKTGVVAKTWTKTINFYQAFFLLLPKPWEEGLVTTS